MMPSLTKKRSCESGDVDNIFVLNIVKRDMMSWLGVGFGEAGHTSWRVC
jgi:hypothetical protein